MSGFGINNFSNNKPIIKEAHQTQDGGAGNLGYFEREEEENKKEQSKKNESIFGKEKTDSFGKGEEDFETEDFSISKLIAQIILAVRTWFKKTFLGEESELTDKNFERDSFEKE